MTVVQWVRETCYILEAFESDCHLNHPKPIGLLQSQGSFETPRFLKHPGHPKVMKNPRDDLGYPGNPRKPRLLKLLRGLLNPGRLAHPIQALFVQFDHGHAGFGAANHPPHILPLRIDALMVMSFGQNPEVKIKLEM